MTQEITRDFAKIVRDRMHEEMEKVAKEFNLELTKQSARYTSDEIAIGWEFRQVGTRSAMLEHMCNKHNIDIESHFIVPGSKKTMKLFDYNTRARTYPFIAEEIATGKRYRLALGQVLRAKVV